MNAFLFVEAFSTTISDGRVFFGYELGRSMSWTGMLICLNASTGIQAWNRTTPESIIDTGLKNPARAVADGRLLTSENASMRCINASTGATIWTYETNPGGASTHYDPTIVNGIVLLSTAGQITSLNITSGKVVWSYVVPNNAHIIASPAVSDGKIFGGACLDCNLYNLTVAPVFYDNTGTVPIQPSSWTIKFPNDTITTVASTVAYDLAQAGDYSIVSVKWREVEVVPAIPPSTVLASNQTWSPTINCLLPTKTSISLSSSTSYVGFKIGIIGNLTCNEANISKANMLLSYSVTGGLSWNDITLVKTSDQGSYSAVWMPSATGNYLIRAFWAGNATYPTSSIIVNLAVTSFEERNVFSVASNSTVTELTFDSKSGILKFSVEGSANTVGYVKAFIAKDIIANIADIKVRLDGKKLNYTATSVDDSWLLYFIYQHSTHLVEVDMSLTFIPEFPTITLTTILLTILAVTLILVKRKLARIPIPPDYTWPDK
jgi:outer membrane protein assembly factor BamB